MGAQIEDFLQIAEPSPPTRQVMSSRVEASKAPKPQSDPANIQGPLDCAEAEDIRYPLANIAAATSAICSAVMYSSRT